MELYFENFNFIIIKFGYFLKAEEFKVKVVNLLKLKPINELLLISKYLVCTLPTRLVLFKC